MPKLCVLALCVMFLLPPLAGCVETLEIVDYILSDDYYYDDYDDYDDDYYYDEQRRRRPPRGHENRRGNNENYQQSGTASMAREVLALVNQQRRRAGAGALAWDSTAASIAQQRARETTRYFSHTRPNGSEWDTLLRQYNVRASAWGENIAYGQWDADDVMDSWMNSSGHRQNILNRNYTHMGVGCFQADNGQLYWVQIFLRK